MHSDSQADGPEPGGLCWAARAPRPQPGSSARSGRHRRVGRGSPAASLGPRGMGFTPRLCATASRQQRCSYRTEQKSSLIFRLRFCSHRHPPPPQASVSLLKGEPSWASLGAPSAHQGSHPLIRLLAPSALRHPVTRCGGYHPGHLGGTLLPPGSLLTSQGPETPLRPGSCADRPRPFRAHVTYKRSFPWAGAGGGCLQQQGGCSLTWGPGRWVWGSGTPGLPPATSTYEVLAEFLASSPVPPSVRAPKHRRHSVR